MPPNDSSEPAEDAGPSHPDASFTLKEAALSDDDRDFARTMGFGDDGSEGASTMADVDETHVSEAVVVSAESTPQTAVVDADEETHAEPLVIEDSEPALDPIHSRSATDSFQGEIEAGAAALGAARSAVPVAEPSATDAEAGRVSTAAEAVALRAEIEALKAALAAALEEKKDGGGVEGELDALSQERDQLFDDFAALSSECARAKARNEELAAALKNARRVLTPLPEGERSLRAEVLGLRSRLEESAREITGLSSQLDAARTDLAIATARVDDREHELSVGAQERDELSAELEEQTRLVRELRDRDREAIALSSRLQAENNELRSTQIALEETIEARDLELAAREEHLSVLRQGLQARDLQILEVQDQMEAARQQAAALDSESRRQALVIRQLEDRISRRDDRIAALVQTLGEIESAIGNRKSAPLPGDDEAAGADSDATA